MNIYDLLQLLIDDSSIGGKEAAHELIRELRHTNAFGTVASTESVDGETHVHVRQEEPFDNLRHIIRCGTCRENLSEPFFPQPNQSTQFHKSRWYS